ncbi:MAG: DUF433 domain-containing protein [Saprospiraceae bacterium]
MKYLTDRITVDPDLCGGRPTIRGMRITVQTVLEYLAAGDSKEEILEGYPWLEAEDIDACLQFAAKMMADYRVLPLAKAA